MKYLSYLLAVFFVQIGLGVVGPVLPDLKDHFGLNITAAGMLMSSYGLARVIFDLPGGFVAQKLHPALGIALGVALSVGGSLCSAMAAGFPSLVAGSFVAGMGSAFVNVVILTLLTRNTDRNNRGRVLGVHISFFLAGVSVGPVVGGLVGARWGWRSAFYCSALAAAVAMVITMRQFLKDREAAPGYGAAEGTQAAAGDSPVCSGGIYLPGLVAVNLVTFVLLFALEGFSSTIIPLLGSLTLGLSADKLGIILAAGVVMRFVVGLAAGMLSDRYGRTRVLVPCLVTAGVGIMAVLYATNWWIFLAAVLIFSIGRMGNNIPLALLGDLTHPSRIGWMTAVNRFVADSGLALGPLVLGTIADKRGFETAGAFAVAVSWLATLVLWYVFKKRPQEKYAAD